MIEQAGRSFNRPNEKDRLPTPEAAARMMRQTIETVPDAELRARLLVAFELYEKSVAKESAQADGTEGPVSDKTPKGGEIISAREMIPAAEIAVSSYEYGKMVQNIQGNPIVSGYEHGLVRRAGEQLATGDTPSLCVQLKGQVADLFPSGSSFSEDLLGKGILTMRVNADGFMVWRVTRRPERGYVTEENKARPHRTGDPSQLKPVGTSRGGRLYVEAGGLKFGTDSLSHASQLATVLSELRAVPVTPLHADERLVDKSNLRVKTNERPALTMEALDDKSRLLLNLIQYLGDFGYATPPEGMFTDEKTFLEALGKAVEVLWRKDPEGFKRFDIVIGPDPSEIQTSLSGRGLLLGL